MIDVPPTTFDRINSGSGPHLDFTMLGAFSEPALDGRDLWSPGQEAVVFVTLLICPYDSSFILPDIYVVPLTCTLEAQMLPELSDVKARGVFICLPKRWQVSHPPATWSCHISKNFPRKPRARSLCWGERRLQVYVEPLQGWSLGPPESPRAAAPASHQDAPVWMGRVTWGGLGMARHNCTQLSCSPRGRFSITPDLAGR